MSDYDLHLEMLQAETSGRPAGAKFSDSPPPADKSAGGKSDRKDRRSDRKNNDRGNKNSKKSDQQESSGSKQAAGSAGNVMAFFAGANAAAVAANTTTIIDSTEGGAKDNGKKNNNSKKSKDDGKQKKDNSSRKDEKSKNSKSSGGAGGSGNNNEPKAFVNTTKTEAPLIDDEDLEALAERFTKDPTAATREPKHSKELEKHILESTVYLRYLPNSMTRKKLREILDECGNVEKIRVCERKSAESAFMYGFVQFDHPDGAQALSGRTTPLMAQSDIQCSTSHNLINDRIAGDVIKGGPGVKTSAFGVPGRDSRFECTLKQFASENLGGGSQGSAAVAGEKVDPEFYPTLPGNPTQPAKSATAGGESLLDKIKAGGLQQAADQQHQQQVQSTVLDQLAGRITLALELAINWVEGGMTEKEDYGTACFKLVQAGQLLSELVHAELEKIKQLRLRLTQEKVGGTSPLDDNAAVPAHAEHVRTVMSLTEAELTLDLIAVTLHVAAGEVGRREIRNHAQNMMIVARSRVRQILSYTTDAAAAPIFDSDASEFSTLSNALAESDTLPQNIRLLIADGSDERHRFISHVVNCLLTMGMLLEKECALMALSFYSMAHRRIKEDLPRPAQESPTAKHLVNCLQSAGKTSFSAAKLDLNGSGGSAVAEYLFSIADLPPPDLMEELPVFSIQLF